MLRLPDYPWRKEAIAVAMAGTNMKDAKDHGGISW